ncbi:ABC transporter permease [Clostridium sp. YIM B02515]|uniref:ABC transporter permease n=1 Tax=Clostridium rhizosphaerae TaxID=2803861 RepID=A0ABS1T6X5_9CLOT|nr:ABC transporter permease [Clostridium rhizosphaerae]MBL4935098.1 ABC transporter permease [Clostridium rhizosphaerae]
MKGSKLLTLFVSLVYIFLIAPLLIIVVTAFDSSNVMAFPPKGFSMKWFINVFSSDTFMTTLGISVKVAVLATIIALIIGVPAAYALSRKSYRGKAVIQNIFLSPIIVPGVVLGFAFFRFLVIKLQLEVFASLLIGHVIIVIPYIIRVVGSSLENLDFSIEEAAVSLGATKVKAFFMVVLPNITSGVIAAFMLAFINSFNNVPASLFLTGPGVSTLPISMMTYVEYNYDPTISALSVILMILTVFIMFIVEKTLGLSNFNN